MPTIPTTQHLRRFARRTTLLAATSACAALTLTGCSGQESAPIESTVTFKTIERPYIDEQCGGFPLMCNDVEIPTRYRLEVTYPNDPTLFTEEFEHVAGRECWFEVKPDEYTAVELGDTVKLRSPNTWSGETCDLVEDLAPYEYMPETEFVPDDVDYGAPEAVSTGS